MQMSNKYINKVDIWSQVPTAYRNSVNFSQFIKIEEDMLNDTDGVLDTYQSTINDWWIITSTVRGVEIYEDMLDILPSPLETLEFRKQRIINRLSLVPPLSMPFLRQRLDAILGKDKYNAYLNYDTYTLYIENAAPNVSVAEELYYTVSRIKPANIVFVNVPLLRDNIYINSTIETGEKVYNYRLSTTWKLGEKPFVSMGKGGIIKVPTIRSISEGSLTGHATLDLSLVHKARINDVYDVTIPSEGKTTNGNLAIFEYEVPYSAGIKTITNIKLFDVNNVLLENAEVYVKTGDSTIIRNMRAFEEGVVMSAKD